MKSGRSSRGFTLLETLVAALLIGIVALAAVPLLSSQNPTKLDVAAAEVGNALRFAFSEAGRVVGAGCVWVEGSVPGHLWVFSSATCSSDPSGWVVVSDPLTKRALDVDASGPDFSGQVSMVPKFVTGGTPYKRLMIGPGTTQLRAYDGTNLGPLEAGSGVVLTLGSQSVTVALNETTGLVTLP